MLINVIIIILSIIICISGVTIIHLNGKLVDQQRLQKDNISLTDEVNDLKLKEQRYMLQNEILENRLQEYENIVEKMESILSNNFSNLSNKTLNEQTNSFLQRLEILFEQINQKHQQQTGDFNKMITPVLQSIEQFQTQTKNLENERSRSHHTLNISIENMNKLCSSIKEQMNLLTQSGKMAGKWGEIQLKRLLELSGLLKHCDFLEQCTITDEEGGVVRPDILINLPDNTYITIDAKTPLASYIKYRGAQGDERSKYKKEYFKALKTHISTLGSKKYWNQFTSSPTMVIMFLPGEEFWSVALEEDPEIMEYAYNVNVVVTTPLTLIPLLRIMSLLWSRYKISEEAEELRSKSLAIYEYFLELYQLHNDMGKQIDNLSKSYNRINFLQEDMSNTITSFQEKYFPSLSIFKKKYQ